MIMRLGMLPLFLFSGTFFPISQLPRGLRPLAVLSPLWHGVELARDATTGHFDAAPVAAHVAVLVACVAVGARRRRAHVREAVELVTDDRCASSPFSVPFLRWRRRPWRLVERNVLAYRRIWYIFLSGFAEPLLFLLVDRHRRRQARRRPHVGGHVVAYRTFVAPGLLAIAAMNGSLLDTTFNFFLKMKYSHTYDAVLATPAVAARRRGRRDHVGAAARRDLLGRVPR